MPWFELRIGSLYIKAERFPGKTVAALGGALAAVWPVLRILGQ